MFLVRWTTMFVSLPFAWAGRLLLMFKVPLCVPFLRAAWAISGNGEQGRLAILVTRFYEGRDVALMMALRGMDRNPRPQVAVWAGMLTAEIGDLGTARAMFELGRQLGGDPAGELDLLALQLAALDPEQDLWEVAAQLDLRRDLQPNVSKLVHSQLMWADLFSNQPEEARRRAEHVLKVEEVAEARMALWAVETMAGDDHAARAQYDRALMPEAQKVYFEVMGNAAMGDVGRVNHLRARLRELDASLAQAADARLQKVGA